MTSLTCSSRQARTQRVHWMQASRLTAIAGCDRSGATGARAGNRGLPTSSCDAHAASSLCRVYSLSPTSESSSSRTSFCDFRTRSLSVETFIPALGARQQRGRQDALAGDLDHA